MSRARGLLGRLPFRLASVTAILVGLSVTALPALGASRLTPRAGQVRVGVATALPPGSRRLAVLSSSTVLRVTVSLRPRDAGALVAYANAVSDPGSAAFRRFLRPAQFARRFAPTAAQAHAVIAALRRQGLSPGPRTRNGLAIPIEAPAGVIERAFSLSLSRVRLPDGDTVVVSSAAPALQASVAALVQGVIGLGGVDRPAPGTVTDELTDAATAGSAPANAHHLRAPAASSEHPQVVTGGPQPCAAARSAAAQESAYTADQIASAYEFSGLYRAGDLGKGATIAVYELEPDDPADIAAYQSCYGTHAAVSYIPVDGGAGSGSGSGEAALDIEQLIGLAPRARLLVYQGPNTDLGSSGSGPYDTYNAIVSQDRASVVSTSWGACEQLVGATVAEAENILFEEAAVQGQTVLAASGDSGSEGCDGEVGGGPDQQLAVQDPASQPYVTGAGGTSLTQLGPPPLETTWNDGGKAAPASGIQSGAGGGGISSFWPMPTYQRLAPAALNVVQADSSGSPCEASAGYCREVPDVSADADPRTGYVIYYNGSGSETDAPSGWQGIGGTSADAPLWAALVALADASKGCGGARLGFVNPVLYRLAGADEAAYFNDVTTGDNDYLGTAGGRYPAAPGYDMATGLGTPRGAALAAAMCRAGLRLIAPGEQHSVVRRRESLRLRVSDAAGAGLRLSARGLPPGLHLRAARRRITGRPRKPGSYRVVLRASDRAGAVRIVSFRWIVSRRPRAATRRHTHATSHAHAAGVAPRRAGG